LKIPVIGVSRGWTRESLRVRVFEWLDRINLRRMDHVVCVSQGQADKVLRAGVPCDRVSVIHNAIRCERFATAAPGSRSQLANYFPSPPGLIVGAAGRLSPEKGFEILVQAAVEVREHIPDLGFVLFGEGPLRPILERQVAARGLQDWFAMPGFRDDLDELLPSLDLFCSSSYSEGLPNVILEAHAAGVPVVATAVGGTPEVVAGGVTGFLVPAGCPTSLAGHIVRLALDASLRERMGTSARDRVQEQFSFPAQAKSYRQLFRKLRSVPSSESPFVHTIN
jgi:glycosyltransferase involved in cell wall biosynthesis